MYCFFFDTKKHHRATVQWAMIDQLKNPSDAFKDVIRTHFRLQKDRVLANAKKWLTENNKLYKVCLKSFSFCTYAYTNKSQIK